MFVLDGVFYGMSVGFKFFVFDVVIGEEFWVFDLLGGEYDFFGVGVNWGFMVYGEGDILCFFYGVGDCFWVV